MTAHANDGRDDRGPRVLQRLGASAFLLALAVVQQPGRVASDTKLDLAVDPSGYLARALTLWDSSGAAGQLQNQAYGYLWPMGPFFAATEALSIPAWVAQRLWWAVVLLVAFHGMQTLLTRLQVGTGGSRLLASMSYALAPRMLLGLGAVSSEIWPMAVAPWALVPLVAIGARDLWPAALRSALAVLMAGAVNAVATGAVLVLPVVWILTRADGRWRLMWRWALATTAVSLWWLGPLLLLGRYSPPFLSWIESAAVSTSAASVTEALRGTTQWLAVIGAPADGLWPAGPAVVTTVPVVAMGCALAALGLAGIYAAPSRWAWFTRWGLLAGLVLVTLGATTAALPWAGTAWLQPLLDGPLAPLRNTHKFEPVIRVPITIGIAHAVPVLSGWGRRRRLWGQALVPAGAAAAVVAVAASPALVGVVQRGDFVEVPGYWGQAADYLGRTDDGGRTLVVPGAALPASYWGNPRDEPLQPLASAPWAVRNGVPLGSAGATRLLNDIEERLVSGYGGPELSKVLHRLGVSRVVLRADLDHAATGGRSPAVTEAALRSAGLRRVTSFGSPVDVAVSSELRPFVGAPSALPAITVFEVPDAAKILATEAPVGPVVVSGGPEAVALLRSRAPVILASDERSLTSVGSTTSSTVLTDTLQRREANFAAVRSVYGSLMHADDPYRAARQAHDWLMPWVVDGGASVQTTAILSGAAAVDASSSLAIPGIGQRRDLSRVPTSAFDGSGDTVWESSGSKPVGQWIEVRWDEARELGGSVRVTFDMEEGAKVAAVNAYTDGGRARTAITAPDFAGAPSAERYAVEVALPPGPSDHLRLEVADLHDDRRPTVVISDIGAGTLPRVEEWARMPGPATGEVDAVLMQTSVERRYACIEDRTGVVRCDGKDRAAADEQDLRREFDLPRAKKFSVSGTVIPRAASGELLQRIDGVTAEASEEFHAPQTAAPLAVDGDPSTYWAAAPKAPEAWIKVAWPARRSVSRVALRTDPAVGGLSPTRVRIQAGGRSFERRVRADGSVTFPRVWARQLKLTVLKTQPGTPGTLLPRDEPSVVIGEVEVGSRPWTPAPPDQQVGVGCGFGPALQVDGEVVPTRVVGTRDELQKGAPLTLRACDQVDLGASTHRARVLSSPGFAPRTLSLSARSTDVTDEPGGVTVTAIKWGNSRRSLEVGPRAQPVVVQVRENANPGWVARSGGRTLDPVTVDGWSQGWVLPSGDSARVELEFTPQRTYVLVLGSGAALAGLLAIAAVHLRRRERGAGVLEGYVPRPVVVRAAAVSALSFLGGPLALVGLLFDRMPARWRPRGVLLAVAGIWVTWSALAPWPRDWATNRSALGQFLALAVVGAVLVRRSRPDVRDDTVGDHPRAQPSESGQG